MDDNYITIKEAAERFGVQHDRLRRAAYEGRLRAQRDGFHWMVLPSEVERFLREGGRAPQVEVRPRREGRAGGRALGGRFYI